MCDRPMTEEEKKKLRAIAENIGTTIQQLLNENENSVENIIKKYENKSFGILND